MKTSIQDEGEILQVRNSASRLQSVETVVGRFIPLPSGPSPGQAQVCTRRLLVRYESNFKEGTCKIYHVRHVDVAGSW